jgi:transcriptional regulator with XRE-family HTH domain
MVSPHQSLAQALMDFPQRLVLQRKARKLTQHGLADLAGIHITQIQRYEKGDAQPTLEMIRKLSKALAVSADGLLFDEGERGPDDALRLQFEVLQQFDEEERQTALAVLEGLILKHQAKQSQLRSGGAGVATVKPKKTASVRR